MQSRNLYAVRTPNGKSHRCWQATSSKRQGTNSYPYGKRQHTHTTIKHKTRCGQSTSTHHVQSSFSNNDFLIKGNSTLEPIRRESNGGSTRRCNGRLTVSSHALTTASLHDLEVRGSTPRTIACVNLETPFKRSTLFFQIKLLKTDI